MKTLLNIEITSNDMIAATVRIDDPRMSEPRTVVNEFMYCEDLYFYARMCQNTIITDYSDDLIYMSFIDDNSIISRYEIENRDNSITKKFYKQYDVKKSDIELFYHECDIDSEFCFACQDNEQSRKILNKIN